MQRAVLVLVAHAAVTCALTCKSGGWEKSGVEVRLHGEGAGDQKDVQIVGLEGAGSVAIWKSATAAGAGAVAGRVLKADGTFLSEEFAVTDATNTASVGALSSGGFVVVWTENDNLVFQMFSQTGGRVGHIGSVDKKVSTGFNVQPQVTGVNGGGFVIAWIVHKRNGVRPADRSPDAYVQEFTSGGSPASAGRRVNTVYESQEVTRSGLKVAKLNDGYVVALNRRFRFGAPEVVIHAYHGNGARSVNAISNVEDVAAVAGLASGGFVVVYNKHSQQTLNDVNGQLYTSAGKPAGPEFVINEFSGSHQTAPAVTGMSDGGFVVTWNSMDQDSSMEGVYHQRYNSDATKNGPELQVNSHTQNRQYAASVASAGAGRYIIAWQSNAQDGDRHGVYAQAYSLSPRSPGRQVSLNGTLAPETALNGASSVASGSGIRFNSIPGALTAGSAFLAPSPLPVGSSLELGCCQPQGCTYYASLEKGVASGISSFLLSRDFSVSSCGPSAVDLQAGGPETKLVTFWRHLAEGETLTIPPTRALVKHFVAFSIEGAADDWCPMRQH